MRTRILGLLLVITLIFFTGLSSSAQGQSTRRRVSITLKGKDPVSGYLIRSDADTIVVEDTDGKIQALSLDDVTMIFVAPVKSKDESVDSSSDTVQSLRRQTERLSGQLSAMDAQQQDLTRLERLSREEGRAESLRSELQGVQEKEANLQARAEEIEYDLRPENIKRAIVTYGGQKKEDAVRQRRSALEAEMARVRELLQQLAESRARLEATIATADSEVERLRQAESSLTDSDGTGVTVQGSSVPRPTNSGGTVNVRGYYRKDGTYVRPHTRSAPRRRN